MDFTASHDIAAPLDAVWTELSDFQAIEALARDRGASVQPHGPRDGAPSWSVAFDARGKRREMEVSLRDIDPARGYVADITSSGIEAVSDVTMEAVSPAVTRVTVATAVGAKSLSARLLLQSAKLAKGTLDQRYAGRIADLGRAIERRA
ncbi:MAG: SRPBCC family protein, partial [Paracoccaceae bacterium]